MGTVFGRKGEEVDAMKRGRALGDGESRVAGENRREGGFAGAVRTHDSVNFTAAYGKVDTFKYFFIADGSVEVFDIEEYFGLLS